jgi:hypothetical protein
MWWIAVVVVLVALMALVAWRQRRHRGHRFLTQEDLERLNSRGESRGYTGYGGGESPG